MQGKGRDIWWQGGRSEPSGPERLRALADWCETLGANEQRQGFKRVLDEIDLGGSASKAARVAAMQWVALLADSGAFESAAVAIVPRSASYNIGRLTAHMCMAQVTLHGSTHACSGNAQSFSMALVAALVRALAAQSASSDTPCVV